MDGPMLDLSRKTIRIVKAPIAVRDRETQRQAKRSLS
jgi:hypothetical protein